MEQFAITPDEPERWLPVAGYEGFYEVSDLGRVRSVPRTVERPGNHGRYVRRAGRVLKPGYAGSVASVGLCRDGKSRTFRVHILVARAFLGPCPEGHEVCHGPAGRLDNSVANLSYGTHLKNCGEDMRRDGTLPAGVWNGRARLTEEIVRECRVRAAAGESCAVLAREFGVEDTTMRRAVAGTAWRHVAQPTPPSRRREEEQRVRPIHGRVGEKQMVTARWDASLLQAARLHAESKGLTLSDVVRLAVTDYLAAVSSLAAVAGA